MAVSVSEPVSGPSNGNDDFGTGFGTGGHAQASQCRRGHLGIRNTIVFGTASESHSATRRGRFPSPCLLKHSPGDACGTRRDRYTPHLKAKSWSNLGSKTGTEGLYGSTPHLFQRPGASLQRHFDRETPELTQVRDASAKKC